MIAAKNLQIILSMGDNYEKKNSHRDLRFTTWIPSLVRPTDTDQQPTYVELVSLRSRAFASRPHTLLLGHLDHVPWIDTDKIKVFCVDFADFLPRGRSLTTWPCFGPATFWSLPPRKHPLLPPHPPYRVTVTFLETPPPGRIVTYG